jgi:hypothetical protein
MAVTYGACMHGCWMRARIHGLAHASLGVRSIECAVRPTASHDPGWGVQCSHKSTSGSVEIHHALHHHTIQLAARPTTRRSTYRIVRTYVPPLSRAVVLYHSSNQTPPTTCSSERSFNFQILLPTTFVSNYPNMLHLNTFGIFLAGLLILFVFFLQKNT